MENFYINDRIVPLAKDPDALVLHPHTQRTGGNTMRRIVLAKVYGPEHIYSRMYRKEPVVWRKITDAELTGVRAFADHFDFRDNPKVTRPLLPVAILRHPVYRAVSLYHFVRRKKTHKHHALARDNGLENFYAAASQQWPRYYSNLQCRRICGIDDARMALETLDAKFLGAGFTEQLHEFVGALGGLLGWPKIDVREAEPDAERYEPQITPSFRETVLADNAEDMVLYETMRKGPPYTLALRTPRDEARTLVNRARQWAKVVMGK